MNRSDDASLYSILCSNDPNRFREFCAAVGARLKEMDSWLAAMARTYAPDFDNYEKEEVIARTRKRTFEHLCDQFNGRAIYRFDPNLAPFGAWVLNIMAGAKIRPNKRLGGIVGAMRQEKKRSRIKLVDNPEELDAASQNAQSGARLARGGQSTPMPSVPQDSVSINVPEALLTLSARENLILRLEISLDDRTAGLHWLREAVKAAGFQPDAEVEIMQRALKMGISDKALLQKQVADLLGISTRQVRNLKARACEKLRMKYFPDITSSGRAATKKATK